MQIRLECQGWETINKAAFVAWLLGRQIGIDIAFNFNGVECHYSLTEATEAMCIDRYVAEAEQQLKKAPAAMKEYVGCELQAICDALNAIVEKGDCEQFGPWLKVWVPGMLHRAMRVDIAWDNDAQEFRPVK